jgi:hypothetical protein
MFAKKLRVLGAFAAAAVAIVLSGQPGAMGQERKKANQPADGTTIRGTLASVDGEKNTITLTVPTGDRKTERGETKKTYTLAKDAKIQQDAAEAKLADLKPGHPTVLKLDNSNVISVTVVGGTGTGEFRSANLERNTIVVFAGRNMARQVVHLLKETKVFDADGKPIKLQDLKPGTRINMTRSVEDGNTAVRLDVVRAKE